MPVDALLTLGIVALTLIAFATDRLRLDVVALLALVAVALTGVASMEQALAGFSNPAVVMIAGLFVVGAGLTETGIAAWLGRRLELASGKSELGLVVAVTCSTALVSAFLSSTGTVAILLPIVGSVALRRGIAPARVFMPLAFGAHLGSNLTLISTPPNLIVSDALAAAGHAPFRFFDFFVPGVIVLGVGITYLALVGRRFLPDPPLSERSPDFASDAELAADFGLAESLGVFTVPAASPLIGKTLAEAALRTRHGATVVACLRHGESLRVLPALCFAAGDELRVVGSQQALAAFEAEDGVLREDSSLGFALPAEEALAEAVLPRRSRLVGHTLRAARFRDRQHATVLSIRRVQAGRSVAHAGAELRDIVLRAGDLLLLKGRRKYLANLRDERDQLVLIAEPDADARGALLDRPRVFAASTITLGLLAVMAFGWVPNVVAVLAAALGMVLTGCVRPSEATRAVNWESVILIAGMIPLANALEHSGATQLALSALVDGVGNPAPHLVLALLVIVTSSLGMVLSNTATAVLLAPVAVRLATAFELAPEPLLMGVAFAASAAFATPIASPVNALVMTPGGYRFGDFTRVGLPLQLLVLTTAVLVIPLVWPF